MKLTAMMNSMFSRGTTASQPSQAQGSRQPGQAKDLVRRQPGQDAFLPLDLSHPLTKALTTLDAIPAPQISMPAAPGALSPSSGAGEKIAFHGDKVHWSLVRPVANGGAEASNGVVELHYFGPREGALAAINFATNGQAPSLFAKEALSAKMSSSLTTFQPTTRAPSLLVRDEAVNFLDEGVHWTLLSPILSPFGHAEGSFLGASYKGPMEGAAEAIASVNRGTKPFALLKIA